MIELVFEVAKLILQLKVDFLLFLIFLPENLLSLTGADLGLILIRARNSTFLFAIIIVASVIILCLVIVLRRIQKFLI